MDPTPEQLAAFRQDLLEVCRRHGLVPVWVRVQYDEFDVSEWFEARPIADEGTFEIEQMRVRKQEP